MAIWGTWIIVTGLLWLVAAVGFAWLFGGACRLGGPGDKRVPECQHGIPHGVYCGQCEMYMDERKIPPPMPSEELEARAK